MKAWVCLFACAATAGAALAQVRPPANPLQNLPRVETPTPSTGITLNVQRPDSQLGTLLASTLVPSRIDITGVRSIPFAGVATLFKPMVGKSIRVADLTAAAEACTRLYQDSGYALSFCYVPAQALTNGVVNVVAVEGYVAEIDVEGDAGTLDGKIHDIARHIVADRPLRRATFERYIQILGMLPGTKIEANVPAPTTTDGATRLTLKVDRQRYNGSAGIDFNHPGTQGLFTGMLNGLSPLGEQTSLSALYPPGDGQQEYYAAAYAQMLGSNGLVAKLDASHYHGDPDTDDQLPAYLRHRLTQDRVGLGLSFPLVASNTRNLVAGAGIYGSDQDDEYVNRINGATLGLKTRTRVLHVDLDYTAATAKRVRKLSFGISRGLDALGAGAGVGSNIPGGDFVGTGDIAFTRYNLSASQSDTWATHLGTVASLMGQYSHDSLPSGEQISFGGPRFGLAYDPGEVSGDSGWGAALEVNSPYKLDQRWLNSLTLYMTMQMARVYLNSGQPLLDTLRTIALGMRFGDGKHYSIDLNAAQPVGNLPLESNSRHPRYNLSFSYQLR